MAGFLHADQDQFWKKLKSETKCLSKFQSESSSFLVWKIIQLSPEGDVNIDRDAKRRGRYLALFTDPEGDSCFSIYQISWIKLKKSNVWKSKTSLSRNFVYNVQTFRGFFFNCIFTILSQIQHENHFLPTSQHWQAKGRRFLFVRLLHLSLKLRLSKMSRNETPSWLRSQNCE